MNTLRDAMSHAALGWVKPELDETLRLVRNEVEYFVEDPADTSRMRFCAGYLHQVQGTLRMVELYAPAMVAEELEILANAIRDGAVPDRDEACATLMRGTVLLPDYLERLQNGHRDIPIVLLPLLNEIRSARGDEGINESVLFAFDPDAGEATPAELEHARGSLSGRNRELLDTVGSAVKEELLRIKDALDLHVRMDGSPTELQTQVAELGAVADTLGVMGLGVARGVVVQQRDALSEVVGGSRAIDDNLLLDIAGALLYVDASLDDQVAHLGANMGGDDDPAAVETRRTVEVLAHEAIANFALAREAFVAFIETNWDHQRLLEVPRLLGEVSGALRMLDLQAPADYLQGVQQYIDVELVGRKRIPGGRQLDTLADAMASLEYYLEALRDRRPGREEILDITRSSLEALRYWPLPVASAAEDESPAGPLLPTAADAFAHAGLAAATPLMGTPFQSTAEAVSAVLPPLPPVTDAMPAAPQQPLPAAPYPLVFEDAITGRTKPPVTMPEVTAVGTEAEAAPVFDPVMAEASPAQDSAGYTLAPILLEGAALEQESAQTAPVAGSDAGAFDPVAAFAGTPAAIEAAPGFDSTIEVPAPLAETPLHDFESDHRQADTVPPLPFDPASADPVAEIAAVPSQGIEDIAPAPVPEAEVEDSSFFKPVWQVNADDTLPAAESARETTDETPPLPATEDPAKAAITSALAIALGQVPAAASAAEAGAPSNAVSAEDAEAADFMAQLSAAADAFDPLAVEQSAAADAVPAVVATASPSAPALEGGFVDGADDIDQDIREVFIEEFDEELVNLGSLLPVWRAAPSNMERLRPVRRVFHTLKGSGRLVGARTLGEFSWAIESMLNRVLDGSRPASPAVLAMVNQAYEVLPQLNAALRGNGQISADLMAIQDVAGRVAAGEEAFYVVPVAEVQPAAPVFAQEPVPAVVAEGTPASVDAVLREILEAEVTQHLGTINDWLGQSHPQAVTEELLRAVHTMNGAFAMTDVPEITAVTGPAESLVKRLLALTREPDADMVQALAETAQAVSTTVSALQQPSPLIPSFAVLADRLEALAGSLPEVRWQPAVGMVEDDVDALEAPAVAETPDVAVPPPAVQDAGSEGLSHAHDLSAYFDPDFLEAVADTPSPVAGAEHVPALPDVAALEQPADEVGTLSPVFLEMEPAAAEDFSFDITVEEALPDTTGADAFEWTETGTTPPLTEAVPAEAVDDLPQALLEAEVADAPVVETPTVETADLSPLDAGGEMEVGARIDPLAVELPLATVVAEEFSPAATDVAVASLASFLDPVDAAPAVDGTVAFADTDSDAVAAEETGVDAGQAHDDAAVAADADVAVEEAPEAEERSPFALPVDDALETELVIADMPVAVEPVADGIELQPESVAMELPETAEAAADSIEVDTAPANTDVAEVADDVVEVAAIEVPAVEAEAVEAEAVEAEAVEAEAVEVQAVEAPAVEAPAVEAPAPLAPLTAPIAVQSVQPAAAATMLFDAGPLDFNDLDRELVDIFVEEGKDLLDHCDGLVSELRSAPEDRELLAGLQRDLHTLKGGARMAGINAIGDLGHAIESLLEAVAANRTDITRGDVQLLERGFDRLHQLLTRTGEHRAVQMPDDLVQAFEARTDGRAEAPSALVTEAVAEHRLAVEDAVAGDAEPDTVADDTLAPQPLPDSGIAVEPLSEPVLEQPVVEEEGGMRGQEQVRVRADLLDRLVNHAGEVAIYRSRLEQQLGAFRGAMAELDRTNARLRDQLRRLDLETEAQIVARYRREQEQADHTFDPLELDRFSTLQQLSRALNESAADLGGLQGVLDDLSRNYDALLQQQSRVSSELQDGLMRARMVPFDGLVPRLRRVVRQAAQDIGKQVHLHLEGTHGELDRNVLDRMVAPLEHMLRNSVAHGLESPEQRVAAGKPEEGEITLRLRREGSEIVLEVADDGAGLDRDAIRRRAEQRGLVKPGEQLDGRTLDHLIFASGFTTSEQVSQLAGRGVGMDVVGNEVRQLGGSVDIHSVRGQGVTFTLRLPQTLAVTQAVFVRIGETTFAVPVASVSGIGRISRERFESGETRYHYNGEDFTLHDLGTLVGLEAAKAEGQPQIPLLLVRAGDLRAAVAIDQVLGNREVVVKSVGLQVASVPGIYGATITGEGNVVVILDVAPLVRRYLTQPRTPAQAAMVSNQRQAPLVMVVDDSLTMRKVTGRILERNNFDVVAARDGIEALELLEERVPDLMLLDIEMPRMDGYELATAMRADPRYKAVPIVMITSRSGEKHRQRAFEIGVQRYLGKPYQELDLMRNVYDLLGIARVRE
ncbi:Hpt domain-containing protein [Stenotrophomonas sp. JC08]|uniref:Hpt domain-containing protein n=1 Tax=Stenotrophomonas sp. JC08 TaxID=3445779 RepID=UPI003FA2395B